MKPLKMTLFGVPRLERGGRNINIPRRKVVALMAYLAVTGQPQSRDALAALLWPDHDQSSARANLRRDLSRLKQVVGEAYLRVDRNQAEIVRQPGLEIDVVTFQKAMERVRQHHPAQRQLCADCTALLEGAVALFQADFLAGFTLPDSTAFDDWQFFQTEGLRQDLAEALHHLIDWHVSNGAYERAVEQGRRWVALDPLHEEAQRRLMQLYAWSGQQAAAARQYQEVVRLLHDELGVEPEEETEALFTAIRNRQLAPPHTRTGPRDRSPEGRYELLDLLAVGGHAEVYYGRDRENGTEVVIKRLKPELLVKDATYIERLVREAAALSRLEHPNIVRMLDTFEEEGQQHIVIEYVPGGSLRQLMDREGALALEKALDIALELADALARAHHLNVIHRDLKPDNVLLAADGTPRLTDFGLARLRRDDARLTRTGTVLGSPAYMSPEALRGEELDPRSDIWSFGVLVYEMLAGRKPFEGQQLTPVLVSILQDAAPLITDFRPETPPALTDLLGRILQKERAYRPLSMRQVAAELEAIATGEPVQMATPAPRVAAMVEEKGAGDSGLLFDQAQRPGAKEVRFVGRQETLAELDRLLRDAVLGQAQVAFVTGEAGQGKTSLLQAFMRQSHRSYPNLLVVGGNCNAYTGSGDPYLPFREILEMLTGDVEANLYGGGLTAEHLQRLRDAMPYTLSALMESGPDLLDTFVPARNILQSAADLPDEVRTPWRRQLQMLAEVRSEQRERGSLQQSDLFEQYARVLKAVSRRRPLLLLLDDLQWVDQGSANLLLHLGRSLNGFPIMVLGAYRPAEVALGREHTRHPLETTLYELQRLFGRIVLDLGEEQGRAFIDALLDSEPNQLDSTFRETLHQQTGGHPLFTVELLRGMQERGDLTRNEAGQWMAQTQLDWNTLPARVEGAIGERISRLAPQLQELLEIASVEGEEFAAETVARVLGKDERATARQFSSELDRGHLLVRALGVKHSGNVRLSRYRFRHILIQRYLYNNMDSVEKVYQHEAVGQALEALFGDEAPAIAPQLARHFEQAALADRAAVYLQHAGDQARRAIALEEATRNYEAALAHWPDNDPGGQASILRKIGECQWIMGDLQEALATYETCYELFERIGDLQGAGAVQRSVGRLYWEIGDRDRSLAYYHRSLRTLEQIEESVELGWTFSSLSQMHMLASQYEDAITWGQRALDLAQRLGADEVMTHALNNVGVAYMELGQLERGKAMVRDSLQRAQALNLPHDTCRAYLNLGEVPAGDYAERREILQELATYASRIRAPLYAGSAQIELADLEWELGEWGAALARRAEILSWIERAPSIGYLRAKNSALLGMIHNDLGQFERALEILQETLPLVRSQGEVQIIGPHFGQLTRALVGLGRKQEAISILHEMIEAIEEQPFIHRDSGASLLFANNWLAGEATTARGAKAELSALTLRCKALLDRADMYGTKADVAAAIYEASGARLLAEGQVEQARTPLQDAADRWRALGLPYHEARALLYLASARQQAGDSRGAQVATKRAAAIFEELLAQLEEEADRNSLLSSPPLRAIGSLHTAALKRLQGAVAARVSEAHLITASDVAAQVGDHLVPNLPVQFTPFVGRQQEVAEIRGQLADQPDRRLLTVVGPGGIGKTRLALAAAAQLAPHFKHGVFFVPLAPLTSAAHIVSAIMESLGLPTHERSEPRQQLLYYLHRQQLLLVMDNFEHVLDGVDLIEEILAQATQVKLLVTSRERLNLNSEWLYSIRGLEYPQEANLRSTLDEETLRKFSAVDLLLQRAQMVAPDLKLDEKDLLHALRICQMLEGMPLALVLAAGWLSLLSFEEIAAELSENLAILQSSARDLPERQRSIRAAFDYSWKRLSAEDRRAFMALSVFRGGFTRQAAEAVAGAGLRTLRTLANQSFINSDRKGRFEVHEVLRQLGWEELQQSRMMEEVQQAHSRYYLSGLRDRVSDLYGGRQLETLREIGQELENIRGAWSWALQQKDEAGIDEATEAIFLFGYMPSRYVESIELLQMASEQFAPLSDGSATPTWGRVVARLAFLKSHARPEPALVARVEQVLALAERLENKREAAFALLTKGCNTVYVERDPAAAIPIIEAALAAFEMLGDAFYVVLAKIWLGYCHGNVTGLSNFNRYMHEALQLARAEDNKVYAANATSNLAAGAFCEGDYEAAERFSREALEVAEEMDLRLAMAHGKVQLSLSHLLRGDPEAAQILARQGLAEAREINFATTVSYALGVMSLCRSLGGDSITGQAFAEEALETPTTVFGRILGEWAASVAAWGVQDLEGAWQHARQSMELARETGYVGMTTWTLPVLARVLEAQGQKEGAVALLALAATHRLSPRGWMQRSAMVEELRQRLAAQLGQDIYQRAWQQGAARDLEPTLQRLLAGQPVGQPEAATNAAGTLPAPATELVGRDEELAELRQLVMETPGRLVTVEGPGGMGKTRLALAVATALVPAFEHGVYFVPLATLADAEQLPGAIAEQLAFRFYRQTDLNAQLLDFLRERQTLLVLDNFEHMLEGATLVAQLIEAAPELRILVTSRERLNLSGEAVYALHGLGYPASQAALAAGADLSDYAAIALLLRQARMVAPEYVPGEADRAAIARIAQLVEGMPLALLLAANWLSLLSFVEIAAEIEADIDFLESEARDLPPRQRSMRAVFQGSWKMLDVREQHVLSALSVFRGSFEREAAEAIAETNSRTLQTLLHKSWLQRGKSGRFHIHELLRQYTAEQLKGDTASWQAVRQRHATYYAGFLERQLERLRGPDQQAAYAAVKADLTNIVLAWQWQVKNGAIEPIVRQMLPALFRYCETRAESLTLLQLLEEAVGALSAEADTRNERLRATLLTALGAFFRNGIATRLEAFGMVVPARTAMVREAWEIAARHGGLGATFWDTMLGYEYGRLVDREEGIRYMRQLVPALAREATSWEWAFGLQMLALLIMLRPPDEQAGLDEASQALSKALAIFDSVDDPRERGLCLRALGQIFRLQNDFRQAIERWLAAQKELATVDEWTIAADINWQIGDAYLQMGQIETAFPYYRRMSEEYQSRGHTRVAAMVISKESYEAARFGHVDYARQLREQALAMAQASGDLFSEAWNSWEKGELLRLSGDHGAARNWFEQSRKLFEKFGDATGITFYHRGLGDLALASGQDREAQREFGESLKRAQETDHKWAIAYALAGLGMVAVRLQRLDEARQHLARALETAIEMGDGGVTLRVLAATAYYFQAASDSELALQLATFVVEHPISWEENRSLGRKLLQSIAAADMVPGFEGGSQMLDLWTTAERMHGKLSEAALPHAAAQA